MILYSGQAQLELEKMHMHLRIAAAIERDLMVAQHADPIRRSAFDHMERRRCEAARIRNDLTLGGFDAE